MCECVLRIEVIRDNFVWFGGVYVMGTVEIVWQCFYRFLVKDGSARSKFMCRKCAQFDAYKKILLTNFKCCSLLQNVARHEKIWVFNKGVQTTSISLYI